MSEPTEIPAEWFKLFPMLHGHMTTALISTALDLKIFDLLGDDTRSSEELAAETGTHRQSLNRMLRAISSIGLTTEVEPGRFALTPLGTPLRSDIPLSLHSTAKMFCDKAQLKVWGDLDYSVRTGKPAFERVVGMDYFTYVAQDPELSKHVNEAMSKGTQFNAASIAEEYDFSPFRKIVDVGGGDGTLLATILSGTPDLHGIVFDSVTGVDAAPRTLKAAGVADRGEVQSGDFFVSVPEGGDLYILKSVIHDWDDELSTTILRNCRKVMPADGRLVLVEPVLPPLVDTSVPEITYLSDIHMLVEIGGGERTQADFEALLSASGFRLKGVTLLSGPGKMNMIEAVPV